MSEKSRGRRGRDAETAAHSAIRPGIRAASTKKPTSTSANGSLPEPNDGAHTGTTPRRAQRSRSPVRDISTLAKQLSERDWSILRSVAEHRYLTIPHVTTLHFGDLPDDSGLRSAQRVLARLRRDRILASVTQRIGGIRAGSSGLVHYVDEIGDRLLRLDSGRSARRRFTQPTQRFLDHQLGIADVHVALVDADHRKILEVLRCDIEPIAWRDYVGIGGVRLTLKPDLYAETVTPPGDEYVDCAFIEVDMGTESIPTLLKKCREYEAYRRQGVEQDKNDGVFPYVIWSMTAANPAQAQRRRSDLRKAIDSDRKLHGDLFHVIAPDELLPLMQQIGGEK